MSSPAGNRSTAPAWQRVNEDILVELRSRSATRVEASEEFGEIQEQLAKLAEEDDVIHLAELLREREEAEEANNGAQDEDADEPESSDESQAVPNPDRKLDEAAQEADPGPKKAADEEATESYTDEDDEPTEDEVVEEKRA